MEKDGGTSTITTRSTRSSVRKRKSLLPSNKRKAHNDVECRRKHRITEYIHSLSCLINSCHCGKETRAEILQKAVDKIQELEKTNHELEKKTEVTRCGQSESSLQQQLALLIVDHLDLLLTITTHEERQREETVRQQQQQQQQERDNTSSHERLGFGVDHLLESSFERSSSHQFTHTSEQPCYGVSMATRLLPTTHTMHMGHIHEMAYPSGQQLEPPFVPTSTWPPVPPTQSTHSFYNPSFSQPSDSDSSWTHPSCSSFPLSPQSYPSLLNYQRFPPPTEQYLSESRASSSHSQPVWRPYNDAHSPPSSHHHHPSLHNLAIPDQQSSFTGQPSTSFLVGQLLENII